MWLFEASREVSDVHQWALNVALATAGGGILLVSLLGTAVLWWRGRLVNQVADVSERKVSDLNQALHVQQMEKKALAEELNQLHRDIDKRISDRTSQLWQT